MPSTLGIEYCDCCISCNHTRLQTLLYETDAMMMRVEFRPHEQTFLAVSQNGTVGMTDLRDER
jgi:hypothetical protein